MKRYILYITLLAAALSSGMSIAQAGQVQVTMRTSLGVIELALDADKAPKTVANFVRYAKAGKYNHTIFHRVIANFMIQGGGFDQSMHKTPTFAPVVNEADNGLKNTVGSIAMARTSDPHSASNQFFINTKDNAFLNFRSKSTRGWGYTVFGSVTAGMDVVRKIEAVQTGTVNGMRDVPRTPVMIENVEVTEWQDVVD